jgi:predicted ATPase/DNA-binding SARP family transcriptional activator
VEIGILGPLEVRAAGRTLGVTGSRLRSLLTRLAADAPGVVSAAELIEAVWPEGPPGDPVNGLQSLVSRLRRTLLESTIIAQVAGGYRLAVDRGSVDAVAFSDLVTTGHRQLTDGAAQGARDTLVKALSLWRGEPLADAGDAPYAVARAVRLHEQRLEGRADRIEADLRLGHSADVIAELTELVAAHPLRERLTGQLMRALAADGRTADALAAYDQLRGNLADELGVDPGADLRAVHLALVRGEIVGAPAVPALPAPSTPAVQIVPVGQAISDDPPVERLRHSNLRSFLTSFIGRDDEVQRVSDMLDRGRLATIVGPGGAGKTRLATEAARRCESNFPDGVWLVELAPVSDAATISQAMLGALGLLDTRSVDRRVDRHPRDTTEQLLDSLQAARCLLIMDNCEHLVGGVASLVDQILADCPDVRVLTTSREPLGIVGESLCVVPPLGLPPENATAAESLRYPSVQLLAERAQAVSAGFEVDQANVAHVTEIVRRLDGLPLAIELATARLRVLPIGEIAARLSDRFRLLAGGNRTAVPRHRTLRAVAEWSWDLLTRQERLVAERLAVFPAGADLPSAVAVCSDVRTASQNDDHTDSQTDNQVPADDVGDLLLALVDKSLLQPVGGGLRYRMLETIREYGVERLAERAELDEARLRHARYFAALTAELDPVLRTKDQLAALEVIRAERDNILGALRYLGDCGDGFAAVDLALSLTWYWSMIGANSESRSWLEFALAADGAQTHPDGAYAQGARAIARITSGEMSGPQGWDEARDELRQIAARLADSPPPRVAALALLAPMLGYFGGDEVIAESLMGPILHSSDPWVRAAARTGRAAFAENAGDTDLLRADVEAAYLDFERIGDRWGLSSILARDLGSREDTLQIHIRMSGLATRLGDFSNARAHVQIAKDQMAGQPQFTERAMFADGVLVMALWLSGDRDAALALCSELRSRITGPTGDNLLQDHVVALVRSATGFIAARSGDIVTAATDLQISYPAAVSTKDMPIVAVAGVGMAALAQALGEVETAAIMLGAAARVRGSDDMTDPALVLVTGDLRHALGEKFTKKYSEGKGLAVARAVAALAPERLRSAIRMHGAETGSVEQVDDGLPVGLG